MSSETRPRLLLIATGWQVFREYLLRSISTRYRVHLFHTAEPQWEREYLTGWSVLPSTIDGPAMAREALRVNQAEPIDGVLCWDEGRIHATAHVAEALGLRCGDPAMIWRLRDKAQTRAALAEAGVPQPRSVKVRTLAQALAAAEQVGYPAILKPRGLGASLGVVRVDDPERLREMFAFTRDTKAPDPVVYASDHPVLVEQCVTGEEISVDSVVQDGKVTPLFLARKVVGFPPYAEEVGHYVDANDPLLADPAFTALLQDTHTALDFRDGWTHTEYMLTGTGPKLIEVNGRLGGDLIPCLGKLATGIDPGALAAAAACGHDLDVRPTRRRVAGIRFCYVDRDDTTIASIHFDPATLPSTVDKAVTIAEPGAVVSPPPKGTVWGRVAYVTAVADSIGECARTLDAAEASLRITTIHADSESGV
ncbi:phosphoribosylglycinamide synthetase [Amycolatopsis sp. WAC 01376]|uniref:ATP-grasp domain-containing protein n=1 Tax=Amycolatopsis sp. WAC 01376 TaxID=2203195 RepID=UPI000F793143|nr:ATP-grasp domain-containing protein [Amycolatopsis sp. WAC 01376]RSM56163.1 phosphoribosylglycinamide synthetase [Amycolatopsis sp. WAC 01376]